MPTARLESFDAKHLSASIRNMDTSNKHVFYTQGFDNKQEASSLEVDSCRSCGEPEPSDVVSLGPVPLASSLLREEQMQDGKMYPLSVFLCKKCTLLQLRQTVSNTILFSHHSYFSSSSQTTLESARTCCENIANQRRLDGQSFVIEIGSNDGYLLKNYLERGVPVLGIEPAGNIADYALKNHVPTMARFFNLALAKWLLGEGVKADVVHANNVIAQIADAREAFEAIATILKDDGIAVIEVPYVKALLDNCWFGTIHHEHIFYFSLTSINHLAESANLKVIDVERLAIHGGSLRVTLAHNGNPTIAVARLLENEKHWGVDKRETYEKLNSRIERLGDQLRHLLAFLTQRGRKLAAYGASAKGTIFMTVLGLGYEFEFVADNNIFKQGCLTPGAQLDIVDPSQLIEQSIDYTLLLVRDLKEEIIFQQLDYLKQGGAFIIPLPELTVVSFDKRTNSVVQTSVSALASETL